MATCPRCQAPVDANAVQCAQCHLVLKAHGHPGIPLYRATEGTALCETCTYHLDDSCTFPQRPHAETCTLYHNATAQSETQLSSLPASRQLRLWVQRRMALIVLVGLLGISFLVVVVR